MTRDKEYITKYLEDNYCVVANFDFEYVSKKNNSYFNLQEKPLKNELLLIFGNFIGLGKIFDEWSEYHKNILTKGLFDYFNSLDFKNSEEIYLFVYWKNVGLSFEFKQRPIDFAFKL